MGLKAFFLLLFGIFTVLAVYFGRQVEDRNDDDLIGYTVICVIISLGCGYALVAS